MRFKLVSFILIGFIILAVFLMVALYTGEFGFHRSSEHAVWGAFGDFIGGLLNPVLTFVTILLLIISQYEEKQSKKAAEKEATKLRLDAEKEVTRLHLIETKRDAEAQFYRLMELHIEMSNQINTAFAKRHSDPMEYLHSFIFSIDEVIRHNSLDNFQSLKAIKVFLSKNEFALPLNEGFRLVTSLIVINSFISTLHLLESEKNRLRNILNSFSGTFERTLLPFYLLHLLREGEVISTGYAAIWKHSGIDTVSYGTENVMKFIQWYYDLIIAE